MSENLIKKTCDTIGCRAVATHVLTWHDRDTDDEYTENVCEWDGTMYTNRPALGATLTPMAKAELPVAPQSGYTPCACRDCMDTTVSSDMTRPELCTECADAGCVPWRTDREPMGAWYGATNECQRDDAYGA